MILYRPVGLQELALIYDSGMKAFPARLPQQPIFYPVLDLEYARQTASGWNAKNGELSGYVTQFKVEDPYIGHFETHTVGKSQHQEFWIPAEELEEFNKHIAGHIKVVEAHFGDAFEGFIPDQFALQGKNAVEQFTLLANSYLYKRMEFYLEIKRNHKAVFLNYPFWQTYEFKNPGLQEKIIKAIREAWLTSFPKTPLPSPAQTESPPAEQTYAPEQQSLKPVHEKAAPIRKPRPNEVVKPAQENVRPAKPTGSRSWMRPLSEEIPSIEETDSASLVDPVEEETTPAAQSHAQVQRFADFDDEDTAEGTDLDSFDTPFREEIPAVKQTLPQAPIDPIQKVSEPREQTYSNSLVQPVHANTSLSGQSDSHFVRGVRLGLNGEYREAVEELSRAVHEDPEDVVARTSLGVAFHRLGEDDRAFGCYEAALRIDPRHAQAHYFRANILYEQGDIREAMAGYARAIGLRPKLIEANEGPLPEDRLADYSPIPSGMPRIAKPARRILDLNKALEANPRQANLFKERASHYSRLENYEQVIADYSSYLALQPQDADVLHSRGAAYEQLGQHARALEDYQQAVAINPQLADVYLQRGVTLGSMGNLRQSIASLTTGIQLTPQNPDGYFNRGTAYFQQGDFEQAIEDFSSVIRLSSNDEAAYHWRGISHEQAGHRLEAIADFQQFLRLSQDPRARQEIEQKLSQWNVGNQDPPNIRTANPADRQKTMPAPPETPDLDIHHLLVALGERVLKSTWFGRDLECSGETAEELYALTDEDQPVEGRELLSITSGIRQTRKGDFYALDPGAASYWLFLRAWDGEGFYVETNDPKSKARLKARFPSAEEVDGASPGYEGIFIRL